MSYDQYSLFAAIEEHLVKPKFKTNREQRFYPSEASVEAYDEHGDKVVYGKCLRAAYFRLSGEFEGTPYNAYTQWIFKQGIRVEQMLMDTWKEMGIWVDNNIKFVDREHNISGELDAILSEPPDGQLYGVEVKSFYGYYAEKEIFGNKSQKAFPKLDHLLQTLIYLHEFEDRLPYFRIVYFDRGGAKGRTFKIELHKEGNIIYPKVEGEVIRDFTVNDIFARYEKLKTCLELGQAPPNDFELMYSDQKIEDFFQKGKVAKTKYENWKKGKLKKNEKVGDWQCGYCQYKETCWGDK